MPCHAANIMTEAEGIRLSEPGFDGFYDYEDMYDYCLNDFYKAGYRLTVNGGLSTVINPKTLSLPPSAKNQNFNI